MQHSTAALHPYALNRLGWAGIQDCRQEKSVMRAEQGHAAHCTTTKLSEVIMGEAAHHTLCHLGLF